MNIHTKKITDIFSLLSMDIDLFIRNWIENKRRRRCIFIKIIIKFHIYY